MDVRTARGVCARWIRSSRDIAHRTLRVERRRGDDGLAVVNAIPVSGWNQIFKGIKTGNGCVLNSHRAHLCRRDDVSPHARVDVAARAKT